MGLGGRARSQARSQDTGRLNPETSRAEKLLRQRPSQGARHRLRQPSPQPWEQLRTAGASRDPPCIAHTALGDGRAGKHVAEQQAEGRRTGVVPEEELGGGGGAWKGPPR